MRAKARFRCWNLVWEPKPDSDVETLYESQSPIQMSKPCMRAKTQFRCRNLVWEPLKPNTDVETMFDSQSPIQMFSDFIWDFGKLPFPGHLGKYFIKIGKIRAKIHGIGKIKAIFGLGMTPIYGLKNGQIKSLMLKPSMRAKALFRCWNLVWEPKLDSDVETLY